MNKKEEIKKKIATIGNWGSYVGKTIGDVLTYLFQHQEQNTESIEDLYEQTAQRQLEIKTLQQEGEEIREAVTELAKSLEKSNEKLAKLIAKHQEEIQRLYENPARKG